MHHLFNFRSLEGVGKLRTDLLASHSNARSEHHAAGRRGAFWRFASDDASAAATIRSALYLVVAVVDDIDANEMNPSIQKDSFVQNILKERACIITTEVFTRNFAVASVNIVSIRDLGCEADAQAE